MTDSTNPEWRNLVLAEIASVKEHFIRNNQWELITEEDEEESRITLFVRMHHKKDTKRVRVLKLVYGPRFPRERPREGFVDPDDFQNDSLDFWIDDSDQKHAFKRTHNPPVICLEGTWGFHEVLHKERDPLRANLNKLLLEIQQCYDMTP